MENTGSGLEFTACKYLEFGDNYAATKNLISVAGEIKVVWQRESGHLCQFCSLRGRINQADGCLTKKHAQCGLYEEEWHKVPLGSIDVT